MGGLSIIGDGSCNGKKGKGLKACGQSGYHGHSVIGDNSCNSDGDWTCYVNGIYSKAKIGNNACNAGFACLRNTGVIADGCCNYYDACNYNKGVIKKGSWECDKHDGTTPKST